MSCWQMQGRRLQETGGVFPEIRRGFLGAENDPDAVRSFAAVEWHYSDRLLARMIHGGFYYTADTSFRQA